MTAAADPLSLAAFGFAVDLVTAEVTAALAEAGIPSVLLKGPAITGWLYAGEESRLYGDTDLLVRGGDWGRAMRVLATLGFTDDLAALGHPRMESGSGYPWSRAADGAAVDLHRTLFGIGATPEAVWDAFSAGAVRRPVGGVEVAMPAHSARLLHVALHAVQHGGEALPKPMADLRRAIARVPEPTWREAGELAVRLEAEATFAAGLRLTAAGRRLAEAIGVCGEDSAGSLLRMAGVPTAEGFLELSEARGPRRKLALLRRELFPAPAFLRWWTPLARRGPLGLGAAYLWRLLWLGGRAGPGFLAWRRAVRRSR